MTDAATIGSSDRDSSPAEPELIGTAEGRRIIELLWNPPDQPPGRGPRPRLSLADVVTAGIALADEHGLVPLSMRKVAGALDVGAMSLYTYVPGRSELVELMIDRVHGEIARPDPGHPWRERLAALLRARWAMYERHPWVLDHNLARMPVGPRVLDAEEAVYAAVADAGFHGSANVAVTNFVTWQLVGAARSQISDQDETRHTGVSAEAYWSSRADFWSSYFDAARFPTMAAIWSAGGFDDPAPYALDLLIERLLDAVDRLRPA